MISATAAIIWTCSMYGPSYIGSSLFTFIFFSTLGISGSVSIYFKTSKNIIQSLNLLGLNVLLCYVIYTNIISGHFQTHWGILLALMGGITAFIYSKQSSKFMKEANLSATQILAIRFYPTILLSIVLFPVREIKQLAPADLLFAIITGSFCFIVPIYFAQKAIEKSGPEGFSIIGSLTPLFAAVLEKMYFNNLKWEQYVIYIIYSLLVMLPYAKKIIYKY